MKTRRAWIGIGSNLDDPRAQVCRALAGLAALPECEPGPASSLYRTAPVGETGQPDFCNAVAAVDTRLEPLALLRELQALERAQGRVRDRRWGPRTLDLDLLLYGDEIIKRPGLTVPHPRMHERAFVLVPLAEAAPELEVPGHGPVAGLAAAAGGEVAFWDAS